MNRKPTTSYNWNEFFANRLDGEVWLQNITDTQVSLAIENPPGDPIYVRVPPMPDPFPLTNYVSFDAIKKSANLRQMVSKRRASANGLPAQPILLLLDSEQVDLFYTAKARSLQLIREDGSPDIDAAMAEAQRERDDLNSMAPAEDEMPSAKNGYRFAPPKSAQELLSMDLASRGLAVSPDGTVVQQNRVASVGLAETEVINPKVLHLCQQVKSDIDVMQRMPEAQFLRNVQQLDAVLKIDDWQYIESKGYWPKVRKYARKRISELAQQAGDEVDIREMTTRGRITTARSEAHAMVMPFDAEAEAAPAMAPLPRATQYQGPTGFANAPFAQMSDKAAVVLGPNGEPL